MKVTYNWLKDFINIKIPPVELAEKLTMAGLEVVSLEEKQGDFIFEIEITSNRPDWLSVMGIAREVAAITGQKLMSKLRIPSVTSCRSPVAGHQKTEIQIEDKKDCPFYSARIIRDVKVGPTPEWLKNRLELLGCRSVNNIVDITNYVLFETGQPLHAFDLDKIAAAEKIIVRRAKKAEEIITIDGEKRILGEDILVIADSNKPIALAGIMGGKKSEVGPETRNILLESAIFNPILVRRGRQKIGLQSESAYRFERGVDPAAAKTASLVAQELICKIAAGKPCGYKSLGTAGYSQLQINLSAAYVNKVLGTAMPVVKIKQILSKLGLEIKVKAKNILAVKVPSFRQDLKLPIDLVEEVARIYGYAKIPQTFPAVRPCPGAWNKEDIISGIKNTLRSLGLHEVITYSLVDRLLLERCAINAPAQLVEILNPLSKDQEVLRPSLLPSLVRCLTRALDQQQEQVNIFEIADVFFGKDNSVQEEPYLGIALSGVNSFLIKQGLVKDEVTLLHLKGILENLFNKLGIKDFDFKRRDEHEISIVIGQVEAGTMSELSAKILNEFDIKNKQVVLAEINLKKILGNINLEKKFKSLAKYPAITRDLSLVIKDDLPIKELIALIKEKGAPLLRENKVVDYYQGKQIPFGFKGITVSCVYRADDRTLTEEEVSPVHNTICSLLEERFGIKLR